MEESLKNLLYQGLGVISITKDKVEKVVAELVEKGKLSREEGMKFAEELSTEAKKAGEEFKASGKDTLREWIEKSGIPSREEFEALKARVAELEKLHSAEPAQ
jgi:polyhydroxyalkanoate synthesis regulator phasin